MGPSGCGKSTSLRMLAGLEEVDEGRLFIGDQDVTDLPPKSRDIAMVFQNYALYPHMTVAENMGFALKIAGASNRAHGQGTRRHEERPGRGIIMTTPTTDTAVFRIYIKAPIDRVWAYIVDPAFNGTWELAEENGVTKVTMIHEVTGAPATRLFVTGSGDGGRRGDGGGWFYILSDLKTVPETGASFAA